jgi:hypothetical protein
MSTRTKVVLTKLVVFSPNDLLDDRLCVFRRPDAALWGCDPAYDRFGSLAVSPYAASLSRHVRFTPKRLVHSCRQLLANAAIAPSRV